MAQANDYAREVFRRNGGILRMAEALAQGISRKTLYGMRDSGAVEQLSRGTYRLASLSAPAHPDLMAAAARVPEGVICLVSALAYHELTTRVPKAVDIAIRQGSRAPQIDYPPVHIYRFSGNAFTEGVTSPSIGGLRVRIYSPEKSVAHAFKFRKQLGIELVVEALRLWHERRRKHLATLLSHARHCRVERVMTPYLDALL